MDVKKVGKSIAFFRNFYGMTQKELAEKLGVTDKAVSRWERGIGTPDISLLTKLSIALDIDIESILEGELVYSELHWKGILALNYPDGMSAVTQMFGKRLVYFQLGFFLLVGISEICIRGIEKDILFTQNSLGTGNNIGVNLTYEIVTSKELLLQNEKSKFFVENHRENGIFLMTGLDFLYGKDITRTFRRVMSGNHVVRFVDFYENPTSIILYPKICLDKPEVQKFERGIIIFAIKNKEDLLDAAMFLKIVESHQKESIADLKEIALKRGFIKKK